ncbi:hypothetical protein GCM10009840_14210 [Pseudolysinimonas kribbensis]|uniref:Glycosyltransferase RgtA/B/C/D-like domain-containing protein n=1 Tax=Pseudolysinimonas kribbensis TaxID=433641 RepID=A0ABQ6K3W6_9MICO|nr:hypothetical protein [Pseudolysinimonas kribbensis]GMA94263.1 hypothetical protein GCM10025881_10870 [Pseudolysinimonas kribbensis]
MKESVRTRWTRWVEPRSDGLPNWRVLAWFPALAALATAVLILLRISGTSSGIHFRTFGTGHDPRLLLGTPRLIRSDEWLDNQGWTVSQAHSGFPVVNPVFPGGMDATVLQELPTRDWSTVFRPHEWGYLLFGLDTGIAWFWWVPALALVVGAYLAIITFLPRRPLSAALIAGAVFFCPTFQWDWGPNVLWPAAWALLAMAAIRWTLATSKRHGGWVWAAIIGWSAVTTAMGLYVPFIVPCVAVVVAFAIGAIAQHRSETRESFLAIGRRLIPLAIAAVVAAGVLAAWVATRAATFAAATGTFYPGQRSVPSGQLPAADPGLAGSLGAVFGQSLNDDSLNTVLGSSASIAATVPLFAAFVIPGLVVLVVRGFRRDRRIDWLAVAVIAMCVVVAVYLLVPGLDFVGKVLLFDRVTPTRWRVILAVLLPLLFVLVVRHVDRERSRWFSLSGLAGALLVVGSTAWVGREILRHSPQLLAAGPLWPVVLVAFAGACYLVFVRRGVPVAAALLLVTCVGIGGGVNPAYVGVYDLNDTRTGQAIDRIDARDPGTWVGVGGAEMMALVMETGVRGYSGLQTYPPAKMWSQIDPDRSEYSVWNALAHVFWQWGPGAPKVQQYRQDTIVNTLDPCSAFAQRHVDYVVSDTAAPDATCLTRIGRMSEGASRVWIYEVTRR